VKLNSDITLRNLSLVGIDGIETIHLTTQCG